MELEAAGVVVVELAEPSSVAFLCLERDVDFAEEVEREVEEEVEDRAEDEDDDDEEEEEDVEEDEDCKCLSGKEEWPLSFKRLTLDAILLVDDDVERMALLAEDNVEEYDELL